VIDRPKQGFGVPVHEWFFDRLGGRAQQELLHFCGTAEILDRGAVDRLFERRQWVQLWYLLNLALWHREFIE